MKSGDQSFQASQTCAVPACQSRRRTRQQRQMKQRAASLIQSLKAGFNLLEESTAAEDHQTSRCGASQVASSVLWACVDLLHWVSIY